MGMGMGFIWDINWYAWVQRAGMVQGQVSIEYIS